MNVAPSRSRSYLRTNVYTSACMFIASTTTRRPADARWPHDLEKPNVFALDRLMRKSLTQPSTFASGHKAPPW